MDKKKVRNNMLHIRETMDKVECDSNSKKIMEMLTRLKIIKESKTIMLYLSFNNEVDTYGLLEWCLKNEKRVVVPYCIEEERKMIPCNIKNVDEDLERSRFGFMQPKVNYIDEVHKDEIDVVIVPGVVFDINGNRIGFGGGYYDRFLQNLSDTKSIAICHDFQLVERVPRDDFDIPMNKIVTEKKIVTII